MSAYSADTRTRWLGDVPPEWNIVPAWVVFHERSEKSDPADDRLTPSQRYGVLTQREYMELTGNRVVVNQSDSSVAKRVLPNDFIIHLRSFQGGIELSRVSGKVTNAYTVLSPASGVDPEYYRHFLKSGPFISGLSSMTDQLRDGQSINFGKFSTMRLPLPPLPNQHAIADYLDRETAEIDAMAAELDELIPALEIRRKTELEQTFIRSTDKWGTTPIWSLFNPSRELDHPSEEVLSVYRDHGVVNKSERDDNVNRTPDNLSKYQLVRPGDLVINKMKAWQGSLAVSTLRGIVSPDYQVARPATQDASDYLHITLRAQEMIDQYKTISTGVRPSQWRMYWEPFAALRVPLPPLEEQRRIVQHLDEVTAEIDSMIAEAQELKALLAERRSALITEVVTGRKGLI